MAAKEERISLLDKEQDNRAGREAGGADYNEKSQGSMKSRKKLRCILLVISVAIVIIVCSAVIASAVTITLQVVQGSSSSRRNTVSLDDILNSSFRVKTYSAEWTYDNNILHFSTDNGVQLYSPVDNTSVTIISAAILSTYNVSSVKLSPTGRHGLMISNYEKVYRHSFLANYYVIDLTDNSSLIWALPLPPPQDNEQPNDERIQYATWNTNASAEDQVAFVYQNNVCTYSVSSNTTTKHTSNGQDNIIYNGIPDWVYEEEVFSTDHTLWWSPDSQYIVFLTFNDTDVKLFQYPVYGSMDNVYTVIESIAYPKAGTANPSVKASLLSVANGDIQELEPPPDNQYYIIYVSWAASGDSMPMISWMNRKQNNMTYCLYRTTLCDIVYTQQSNAWIEAVQAPLFTDNGQNMILIDSIPSNDNTDSYLHIIEVDTSTLEVSSLTQGDGWEVTNIIGTTDDEIFYISTETHPWQRHIYRKNGNCLTCDQQKWMTDNNEGTQLPSECHYWSGSCSDDLLYCILQCSGPTLPFTVLVKYDEDEGFQTVEYLEINEELQNAIKDFDLPTIEEVEIEPADESPLLYARVMFPPGASKKCSENYPVLFYVYGGPYSQMIGQYSVVSRLFPLYLSSSLNMIVISVDGRGTGFRGDRFKHAVYRKLGILETEDQITAAQYFEKKCYTDSRKIAIYGSSYGGYMAGMVGASNSNVFSTAISQSPVTDWLYYDTIYTERYMGLPTPQDNGNGYTHSSLLTRAGNLSNVDYMLIHGTGDDNVHFQNSAQLVKVLTTKDIPFTLQFYTDQAHSLSGTPRHLYNLIEHFLQVSFDNGS